MKIDLYVAFAIDYNLFFLGVFLLVTLWKIAMVKRCCSCSIRLGLVMRMSRCKYFF